ncbi:hypothetical protein DSO57_1013927 [Entomophthora muscae]|uniref:Uncharacterized protein n=1 Tax=Entomophthora muscae TaxID=34485 RepID=A0ACC2UR42_9FUNG|nr:hypothetical protein DSO57_1013927 [Entomophthora muscae]
MWNWVVIPHHLETASYYPTISVTGWVKRLSPYQLSIKYKPGKELVTADALSRLYVVFIMGANSLDPDWNMLYLRPEATCYKGLNSVTIYKLKDNKSQFTTDAGNVCRQAETDEKTPYIPTTQ